MNQVDTNLGISEGHASQTARTYAAAASTSSRFTRPPSSAASSDQLITKCDTMYRSPDLSGEINLHVRSNIPRTLVFSIPRRIDPARFHVALSKKIKVDTHRIAQEQTNAYRLDICFPEGSSEQFHLTQQQGLEIDGNTYKPVVPVPENANIIKVSLRYLPPHFTKDDLLATFSKYGTVLQAGRYFNDCGDNIRAFTGAGYVFLQQNTTTSQATAIPTSFDVGPFLRLQAKVVTPHPAENSDSRRTLGQSRNAQPQQHAKLAASTNRRKRNKRGKNITTMDGIEVTADAPDNHSAEAPKANTHQDATVATATALKDSAPTSITETVQSYTTESEESATVTRVQKTPPAVSLTPEPLPHTHHMEAPAQSLAAMTPREHHDMESEDDDDSDEQYESVDDTILIIQQKRPSRSTAPKPGALNVKTLSDAQMKQ